MDLGMWLQEWDDVDEFDDNGTGEDRFCRWFNKNFGSAYLTTPAIKQETSENFEDDLYDLAGGNLAQSDGGLQKDDNHPAQSNKDVDSIYGTSDSITTDFLKGDDQTLSHRGPRRCPHVMRSTFLTITYCTSTGRPIRTV
jgi:hypothetical protein